MITLRRAVLKQCPYREELDAGELVIILPGDAPELHRLSDDIDFLCKEPVTHEDFTRHVATILPEGAQVTTSWHTGPWSVEVTEGAAAVMPHAGVLRQSEHAESAASDA